VPTPTDPAGLTDFFDRYGSALVTGDVSAVYRSLIRTDPRGPRITTVITSS
jgi:hypothetical protein